MTPIHPREPLDVSPDVALIVQGMGMTRPQIDHRVRQGVQLEAAQVSDELVNIICKIAATRRLTQEDITMLHYHATGGTP